MKTFADIAATFVIGIEVLILFAFPAAAQDKFRKEAERSRNAAVMLETVTAASEASALKELLGRASAIGVFPEINQLTSFFLEQATGDGVVSVRTAGGWTAPAFYSLGSVRYRRVFLSGGKFAVILLFIRKDSLPVCRKENITLNDKENVRSGVIGTLSDGQRAEYKDAMIVAFAYVKGHLQTFPPQRKDWGDFTLNDHDNLNKRIYGVKTCDMLTGKTPQKTPVGITSFRDLLQKNYGVITSQ